MRICYFHGYTVDAPAVNLTMTMWADSSNNREYRLTTDWWPQDFRQAWDGEGCRKAMRSLR